MRLEELSLHDFRSHKNFHKEFTKNKVIFYGKNGSGKTSVLEAIRILSLGKSWRELTGEDIIATNSPTALIKTKTDNQEDFLIQIEPKKRTLKKNEKKVSFRQHMGKIPTILFLPEFLEIFSGDKRTRVRFFDQFLAQISPSFLDLLRRSQKAHTEKNALLKMAQERFVSRTEVSVWNTILAQTIPQITKIRNEFLSEILPIFSAEISKISEKQVVADIQLVHSENFEPTEEGVLAFFDRNFDREKAARKNLLSPTKSDFKFFLNENVVAHFASRGEKRTLLLGLLSAQKYFLLSKGVTPILLLDDVFSELDSERQSGLERLCEGAQSFFTTTHQEHFLAFTDCQKIEII